MSEVEYLNGGGFFKVEDEDASDLPSFKRRNSKMMMNRSQFTIEKQLVRNTKNSGRYRSFDHFNHEPCLQEQGFIANNYNPS
jgi:hypothetical protein